MIGNMVDVKGKCVQKISPYVIPVGGVTDYFFGDNQQYWSLLKGQEAPHD